MTLGIYIHIPFCQSKCNYCHFLTMPLNETAAERYKSAVIREIEIFAASHACEEEVDSVYFGGGTPSLLPASHIAGMLAACRRYFPFSENCEISLEANPGTLSAEKTSVFFEIGVNRISMGAQSFQNQELVSIGRLHTSDTVEESLELLRTCGIDNVNLDLMLGIPFQTEESWMRNLDKMASLDIPHVSVYMLDLEDECLLSSMASDGRVRIPEDDLVADLYLKTINYLSSRAFDQYEISNFAQPGHFCRHNLKYWMREKVQGFGLGSHSFDGHSRRANDSQLNGYFKAIDEGRIPVKWQESVAGAKALEETLILGLRLNQGVDWSRLRSAYDDSRLTKYEDFLRKMSEQGFVAWTDSAVRLTPLGMLLSNEILQLFV